MTQLTNNEKAKLFDDICDIFEIGSQARGSNVLVNVRNCKKFADMLHAIEREYFMTEGEPDDDYPNEIPEPVCMVSSWGSDTAEYVKEFGDALNRIYKYDELIEENAALKQELSVAKAGVRAMDGFVGQLKSAAEDLTQASNEGEADAALEKINQLTETE